MLVAAVNIQLGRHLAAQLGLGQHALDRFFHDLFRLPLEQPHKRLLTQTARKAGVTAIHLLLALQPGQAYLLGIDDDNVIAHIHKGHVLGIPLAGQHAGDFGGQAAQRFAAGIHHKPLTVNLVRARNVCRHRFPVLLSIARVNTQMLTQSVSAVENFSADRQRLFA